MPTEVISIFSNRSIAKNGNTTLETPVYLGKCGPDTMFAFDLSASGGGQVTLEYQVGNTPDDTFYTPSNAEPIFLNFNSPPTAASRDRALFEPELTPWMTFKCTENNASPVVVNGNLIVSK